MMGGEPDAAASSISDDEPARVCAKIATMLRLS